MDEIERWAGQVIIAGYEGTAPPAAYLHLLTHDALGGVILFKRNLVGDLHSVAAQTKRVSDASPTPPFIAIDQEGGRVQRLGAPVVQLPPMATIGRINDENLTRRIAETLGNQLAALGFNLDFAPVLDVASNKENPVIGDRSFSDDPRSVARHALAFAEGLRRTGVLSCGKHFPGHGDTREDSHFELPALPHARERLDEIELFPFRATANVVDMVMTAHIVFEALDAKRPATLSPLLVDGLLKGELGFKGLVVSDDLEMKAIADHLTIGGAAVQAIAAGCDLLLICRTESRVEEAIRALAERAKEDDAFRVRLEDAATRAHAVRRRLQAHPGLDRAGLDAAIERADGAAIDAWIAEKTRSLA